jgi:uncharacterized protein (TIGR02453 family)
MSRFEGFGLEVQTWFEGLEADNSKAYFAAHRGFFEESIRAQMEALLSELGERFGGELKVFRQNRDIRFSPNKSPYKTNTYGVLHGSRLAGQGLYTSISARGLVAGSGYHMMARDQLDRYREGVDEGRPGAELAKLTAKAEKAGLELWGEGLATAPRGYPKDHARIELLRRKRLNVRCDPQVRPRHPTRRRAEVRRQYVGGRGAGDGLTRRARRPEHAAGGSPPGVIATSFAPDGGRLIAVEPKLASDTRCQLIRWMGVLDANPTGNVHGGTVMRLCDEAAALAAIKHSRRRVVTVAMDRMTFLHPIQVGELLTLSASVNAAWRTSMEVGVRVDAEIPWTGEVRHSNSAYLTMVALDDDGNPAPVPSLIPTTPDEQRRMREAELRRANRLAEREQIVAHRANEPH